MAQGHFIKKRYQSSRTALLRSGAEQSSCADWRDISERYGPWPTVYERFRNVSGAWSNLS